MNTIVAFSGSTSNPSKTTALVENIVQKAAQVYDIETITYTMADLGQSLGLAHRAEDLSQETRKIINKIGQADALIIGSPVYKGSYPGLFKHFIDLMEPELLYAKPIILAASGGGDRHALMVEHQLRPLFGFFMAHSLPTAIYAATRDFGDEHAIISADLTMRIDKAVSQLAPFLHKNTNNTVDFTLESQNRTVPSIKITA
ncbi:FMN reductase [Bartonella tamiae]|uniref:FMN reductase n=1 Tax=Bartonella tamiae Th239 TaxID=1094558 RepID=J0ZPF0_9HYPH|nr:FMN reductase [Bartonella tamiae]EJF90448.1 FMN reductase [Bartonella tamiae Th239]EJF93608.1 FMN reductase [Bartonella tamiae Th307]